MTQDASSERQVQHELELDREARLAEEKQLRYVLSSFEGRALIWRVIESIAGTFAPSYTAGDQYHTAFNEGSSHVGRSLMLLCQQIEPKLYLQMLSEAQEKKLLDMDRRNRVRSDHT